MVKQIQLVGLALLLGGCGGPFLFKSAASEFGNVTWAQLQYHDFTFKTLQGDGQLQLSKHIAGKKLVMVVYFAPWCPNWQHELPLVSQLYHKYKAHGFDVIGVSEYGPAQDTIANFGAEPAPYPLVAESYARKDWSSTTHYTYRKAAGDKRKWGSPWHIFISPKALKPNAEFPLEAAWVVNGELIESDVEPFIRRQLDLPEVSMESEK